MGMRFKAISFWGFKVDKQPWKEAGYSWDEWYSLKKGIGYSEFCDDTRKAGCYCYIYNNCPDGGNDDSCYVAAKSIEMTDGSACPVTGLSEITPDMVHLVDFCKVMGIDMREPEWFMMGRWE
jgi:hypothetical protein